MKKITSLKLNQLRKAELEKKEMGFLVGGLDDDCCGCGCPGGYQTTNDNTNANSSYTYSYSATPNQRCVLWHDANGNGIFDANEYSFSSTC